MALWLVTPARSISSMIRRTLAANRLAFAFTAAVPRFAAFASWGLPKPGEPEVLSFEVWILQGSTEKYLPAFLGVEGCSVSLPRCRSPLSEATLIVHALADPLERFPVWNEGVFIA
jgi:hypothetical protein